MPGFVRSAPRLTHWLLAFLAFGVWGLLLRPYLPLPLGDARAASPQAATFDTLTAQRINIVDANGKLRLIIANSARFPDAEVRGKAYKRSINDAAGLLFFDAKGEGTGSFGSEKLRDYDVADLTFDYTYQPTDGIRMIRIGVDAAGKPSMAMLNHARKVVYRAGQ